VRSRQAEGIGGVGAGEEALDFIFAEGFGQAAGLLAGKFVFVSAGAL
jgi:hypothetical protein